MVGEAPDREGDAET